MTTRKRGRPAYRPTPAARKKVRMGAAFGMTREQLAIALDIDEKTLAKYFKRELSIGATQERLEVLQLLRDSAERGNVSAQKALLQTVQTFEVPPAPKGEPAAETRAPTLPAGKKEQQQRTAETAHVGSEWEGLLDRPGGRVQ